MQRISDPQMVHAFMRSRTSPCRGCGTATSLRKAVLSPGRNAPCMVWVIGSSWSSRWRYHAVRVPQILPALAGLPEEHLPFDEAAVAVDTADLFHFLIGKRVGDDTLQIAEVVSRFCRKRDGRLAALHGPLDAHDSRMDTVASGDLDDHRIFGGGGVLWCAVPFRPGRRSDGRIAYGLHAVLAHETEQLGLLEMWMQLH